MEKLIFTVGLPASGKSTWAKEQCQKYPYKCVRVNRDDLRRMRGKYWIPEQEDLITEWEFDAVCAGLLTGRNVIVDATNLSAKNRDKMIAFLNARNVKFEVELKDFTDVTPEECIQRDKNRMRTEEYVGEDVILSMAKKHGLIKPPVEKQSIAGLPYCLIVDMDGTLAHNTTRGFYEWSKVGEDTVDNTIAGIVYSYHMAGYKIIVVSGREDVCKNETESWLVNYDIPYDLILMRRTGDKRPDELVKKELYAEYIHNIYNVLFVLDDRNKVVKMWRSLGLKCLQVAEGNF